MTDNEIIKALEDEVKSAEYVDSYYCNGVDLTLIKSVIDLINRLQAEIERLTKETMNMAVTIEACQSEAIKEFAERLKQKSEYYENGQGWEGRICYEDDIDKLVKEMVGED